MKTNRAAEQLQKIDPVLGKAIRKIKLKVHRPDGDHFRSLAEAILSQQISTAAADTIIARFRSIFGKRAFPTPKQVLKAPTSKLRAAGISRQKASYLKDLAAAVAGGRLDFAALDARDDEEVIAILTQVKGIGQWTAEMFLIFSMGRPDVFSAGDLGLQNAVRRLYALRRHPDKRKMDKISNAWKPHRSLAARYLWATLRNG